MDKTGRNGMRVGDLLDAGFTAKYAALKQKHMFLLDGFKNVFQADPIELQNLEADFLRGIELIKSLQIVDSEWYINQALQSGKKVLAEGAQGSLLDIDFGSYPFVTSSNTVSAGACTGLGIAPGRVGEVIGIFKAYCTRVGSGPFPTELNDEIGEQMRKIGNEFGSTTGRPRRCGWLDLPALRYACMINGVTQLIMMKADVLSDFASLQICTSYKTAEGEINYLPYDMSPDKVQSIYTEVKGWTEDLTGIRGESEMPDSLKSYIRFIEDDLDIPITVVSVGPDRDQTIIREKVTA
jgi:adenylosuccinate synthase